MDCPHCGKQLDEKTIGKVILRQLQEKKEKMREAKKHITAYVDYEINNHLINAFEEYVDDSNGGK